MALARAKFRIMSYRQGSTEILTTEEVLRKFSEGPDSGIFTDGSSIPNPGPGGWGFVWVSAGKIYMQKSGRSPNTTNNRMELTALIEAFKAAPADEDITIYSDSDLCVKTINEWAPSWERRGWRRKTGPIANLDLVQELYALSKQKTKINLRWIKAHNGWLWNEYADALSSSWLLEE